MHRIEFGGGSAEAGKHFKPEVVVGQEVLKSETKRFRDLLSCVNIGPKAATVLLFPPSGGYISQSELAQRFADVFGTTEMGRSYVSISLSYAYNSFFERGFLTEKYDESDPKKVHPEGFGLKKDGERYLVPAACLALRYEDRYKRSVYNVLGSSNSNSQEGNIAPFIRSAILLYLNKSRERFNTARLARDLGVGAGVMRKNLQSLVDQGLIDDESLSEDGLSKREDIYTREGSSERRAKPNDTDKTLTMEVVEICKVLYEEGISITNEEVYKRIHPDVRERVAKSIRRRIKSILSHLVREDFLVRENPFPIKISRSGEQFVEEFLHPLWEISRGRGQWGNLVAETRRDIEYYAKVSAELYYFHSRGCKRVNREKSMEQLYGLLLQAGEEGLSCAKLSKITGFNRNTVEVYLKEMGGKIKREKRNGTYYYYVSLGENEKSEEVVFENT
ncbi:MAG: hypothetical protein C4584_00270 [Armatimonadetes bacterium]|nr:MAG: hypothetical protein C4584_00270 [Armatimonadota bacterium]